MLFVKIVGFGLMALGAVALPQQPSSSEEVGPATTTSSQRAPAIVSEALTGFLATTTSQLAPAVTADSVSGFVTPTTTPSQIDPAVIADTDLAFADNSDLPDPHSDYISPSTIWAPYCDDGYWDISACQFVGYSYQCTDSGYLYYSGLSRVVSQCWSTRVGGNCFCYDARSCWKRDAEEGSELDERTSPGSGPASGNC